MENPQATRSGRRMRSSRETQRYRRSTSREDGRRSRSTVREDGRRRRRDRSRDRSRSTRERQSRKRHRRSRSPSYDDGYHRARRKRRRRSPEDRHDDVRRRSHRSSRRHRSRKKSRRHRRRSHPSPATDSSSSSRPVAAPVARRAGVVSDDDAEQAGKLPNPMISSRAHKKSHSSAASNHDDTVGHFKGGEGTIIDSRYRILHDVGLGTFGRVVECLDLKRARRSQSGRLDVDTESSSRVAIKIVRDVKRYYDSALIEADILEDVNRRGGRGTSHCAILYDAFTWNSHFCMVFERLGPSLYDFLKRHNYQPFPMVCVRDFAHQLLEALEFMHSFGLIHTDLKPENILLSNYREVSYTSNRRTYQIPESNRIKVIDFGGATYDNEKKSSIVNTRQYRAPEVILNQGWSKPSDLWSAGCIMTELYTGELLFATHDNLEHLALMEKALGPFPRRMLKRAEKSPLASEAFGSDGRHRMERVLTPESASYVRKMRRIQNIIRPEDDRFLHLLNLLLVLDPDGRAPAHECLRYRL